MTISTRKSSHKTVNISNGFSAVELLITLFVATIFLMSGYQLYNAIIKDGGETRIQQRANNTVYDYLKRYKPNTNSPCPAVTRTPLNNQAITVSNVPDATITVTISCPYTSGAYVNKTLVSLSYGPSTDRQTVSNATFSPAQAPCPTGFIVVPGSMTYGTNDFCVMKYEAKQSSATVPISQYDTSPWASINQIDAADYSKNVVGCTGCHLITDAEWLTIAQNVLGVASNWTSGIVGTGAIFSGHNDNTPNIVLSSIANDDSGYVGTTDTFPSTQRRTLTLTNGEIIWDLAGNVSEWTSGQATDNQPGTTGELIYGWKEWNLPLSASGNLVVNSTPAFAYSAASVWGSPQGLGQIFSKATETLLKGITRGGAWNFNNYAGIFCLGLDASPTASNAGIGFRVAR